MKVSCDENAQMRNGTHFSCVAVSAIVLRACKRADSIKLSHARLEVFDNGGLGGDEGAEFGEA